MRLRSQPWLLLALMLSNVVHESGADSADEFGNEFESTTVIPAENENSEEVHATSESLPLTSTTTAPVLQTTRFKSLPKTNATRIEPFVWPAPSPPNEPRRTDWLAAYNASKPENSLASADFRTACKKPATCVPLNFTTCMGTRLPYAYTSLDLATDSETQEEVQDRLLFWQGLRHVPKCWAVIQPFLCAVYMPKCDNGLVDLPSQELCKVTRGPCRIVELEKGWPEFLKCEDTERFPSGCKNEVRELKFNTSSKCLSPLIETDHTLAFMDGVEGCGIPCQDPLYSSEEHQSIHNLIGVLGGFCLAGNLFAVTTFLIDWRSSSKYPAVILFYMNACFLAASVGVMAQYFPGARNDIVCRKDGTPRMAEPSAGENLSCVIVFILIYYFLMAACVWFVMLAYAWHISFQAIGKVREKISSRAAYFHLVAWSLPLVLTIATMAVAQVDSHSVYGVCFVGYGSAPVRGGLVLAPVVLAALLGGFFLIRGLSTLIQLKVGSKEVVSAAANAKLKTTIYRMGFFFLVMVACIITTFSVHGYQYSHLKEWKESLRSYLACKANETALKASSFYDPEPCTMKSKPSLTAIQAQLWALFGAGLAVSSWIWTKSSLLAWQRWFKRMFKQPTEEPVRLKKHKIIAQAFAKRKELSQAGRLSISIHNTHDDPVGMFFDLNSAASNDVSSAWAAAIPKFVTRRGAVVGAGALGLRRNSMDSDMSVSLRRISMESQQSRRHSLDSHSQLSVHTLDLERLARLHARTVGRHSSRRFRFKSGWGWSGSLRSSRSSRLGFRRRGSSTSQASQNSSLGSQILPAITIGRQRSALLRKHAGSEKGESGALTAGGANRPPKFDTNLSLELERFSLNLPGSSLALSESDDEKKTGSDSLAKAPLKEELKKNYSGEINVCYINEERQKAAQGKTKRRSSMQSNSGKKAEVMVESRVARFTSGTQTTDSVAICDVGTQTSTDFTRYVTRKDTTPLCVTKSTQVTPSPERSHQLQDKATKTSVKSGSADYRSAVVAMESDRSDVFVDDEDKERESPRILKKRKKARDKLRQSHDYGIATKLSDDRKRNSSPRRQRTTSAPSQRERKPDLSSGDETTSNGTLPSDHADPLPDYRSSRSPSPVLRHVKGRERKGRLSSQEDNEERAGRSREARAIDASETLRSFAALRARSRSKEERHHSRKNPSNKNAEFHSGSKSSHRDWAKTSHTECETQSRSKTRDGSGKGTKSKNGNYVELSRDLLLPTPSHSNYLDEEVWSKKKAKRSKDKDRLKRRRKAVQALAEGTKSSPESPRRFLEMRDLGLLNDD